MNKIRFAHILNIVNSNTSSHLKIAQPITLESILHAKNYAQKQVNIELFLTKFSNDQILSPDGFKFTPDLQRSVSDVAQFTQKRKLPIMRDILDRLYDTTDADYLIYSNVDIALMPYFYLTIANFTRLGYESFSINRRTIQARYQSIFELPLMYAEIGEPHRGWDCFVFHRSLYPNFILENICLGAPLVGLAMISNLIAFSRNFNQIRGSHLTFHLGNDRRWHDRSNIEYQKHNRGEVIKILRNLDNKIGGFDRRSPPGEYLRYHNNKIFSFIYDKIMMCLYVPAKYFRSNNELEI